MSLILKDRVRETTTVTGTGSATLLGAVTGYQAFSVVGNTNTCYYTIADQSGPNWEVGIGTYSTTGPTLARTTVLASSNGGSAVNFTSGTKDVFLTYPSENAVYTSNGPGTSGYVLVSAGAGAASVWTAPTSVVGGAGGSSTQVQYNSSGSLAGSANMTFDGSTLTTLNSAYTGTLTGGTGVVNLGSGQFYKDASGNVGIGVVPSAWSGFKALQVGGATSIWSSSSGVGSSFYSNNLYYNGSNRIYTNTGFATEYIQDASAGSHIWFTAPSGTAGGTVTTTERMRIDSSGNVGIGTSSPLQKLSVNGAISVLASATLGVTANAGLISYEYPTVRAYVGDGTGYSWAFSKRESSTTTDLVTIQDSGNLLVGTTTLSNKLSVVGSSGAYVCRFGINGTGSQNFINFVIGENTTPTGVGSVTTNGTTTSYNITSDRRLKENITSFTKGLETIFALKPSQYNYISDKEVVYQGFIADELQSVVPHAVTGEVNAVDEKGNPVYQAVDASFLIPHLVSAIQEQQDFITDLQARLTKAGL